MTSDTPYLHGKHTADAPNFDSDGRPEASVDFLDPFANEPDEDDARAADEQPVIGPEAWMELLTYITTGADSRIISGRAAMVARILHLPSALSLHDLANMISLSPSTCRRRVETLRLDLREILQRRGGASV